MLVPIGVSTSLVDTVEGLGDILPSIENDKTISDIYSIFSDNIRNNNSDYNNLSLSSSKKRRNASSIDYRCLISSTKLKR